MSAKSQRPRNKRIKLVGGGWRMSRFPDTKTAGGSLKSLKRSLRHELKRRDLTVTQRRGLKERLTALLAIKDKRG